MMKKLLLLFTVITFSVFTFAQQVGDYQSGQTGDWSSATTWQVWNGFLWEAASSAPTGGDNVTIRTDHVVTVTASTGNLDFTGNLVINPRGGLDMTGYALSTSGSGTILIQSDNNGTGEILFDNSAGVYTTGTIERYIEATDNSEWHQISIPIRSATTAADIFQNHAPNVWMQRWNFTETPHQTWSFVTDQSYILNNKSGYMVTGDYSFTIDWIGDMTSDGFSLSIPANAFNSGDYGLIGNRFTCSYDAMSSGTLPGTNLDNEIWIWNPAAGNYSTFTGGAGGSNAGVVSTGQSFFVRIIDGTQASSFQLDKTRRYISNGDIFYKKSTNLLSWDDNHGKGNYVMLKVSDGKYADAVFVNFGDSGTDGIESGYDGYKMFGGETSPQLYLVEGIDSLSIDYLKTLEEVEGRVVKMNFKPGKDGTQTIAANLDSLPNTKVTLEDLKTGNLNVFNDEQQYTFNATVEDDPNRFLLHFMYSPTGIDEGFGGNSNEISIYAYNKDVYIANTGNENLQSEIKMYDLLGREVYDNKMIVSGTVKIPVNIDNSYLIVQVISNDNVTTQKIFVK